MELQVNEIKALEPIKFNYEELKTQLTTKVENYKSIVYSEDNIKDAKTDRANLNKLAKALNEEKIRVKNIVLEPYMPFEKQCNELIELVKEASTHADTQIKNFEQQIKDEKLKQIINFFIENVGEYKDLIDFDTIYNERWLNVTYKMEQIEKDIMHIFTKTKTDLGVIDSQFVDESVNKAAKMEYFANISNPSVLTTAILKGNEIIEKNKKLEELKQKEQSSQNITKNEEKMTTFTQNQTEVAQKISNSEQNVETSSEELLTIDFTIKVTQKQMEELKKFLVANGITPIHGISNKDVEFIVRKIESEIQELREESDGDLRGLVYFVQTILKHIVDKGTKETVKTLAEFKK